MPLLKIGSKGPEVLELQKALKAAGVFKYTPDSDFGPQTERALKQYQKKNHLKADGQAGPRTLESLKILALNPKKSLALKCLELTATIETSQPPPHCFAKVSGNFDKMAVSFGALQWNFGQKTLQPILNQLILKNPKLLQKIFSQNFQVLTGYLKGPHEQLMHYFSNIQINDLPKWQEWQQQFKALGYTDECVQAQLQAAQEKYNSALTLCRTYSLFSERAVALMFDISVQNGSIKSSTQNLILEDFKKTETETEKLIIVAQRRAQDAKAEWQKDVLARKETIARGQGLIHKKKYNLELEFEIRDTPAQELLITEERLT